MKSIVIDDYYFIYTRFISFRMIQSIKRIFKEKKEHTEKLSFPNE